jgi:hypothetical protein
MAVMAIDMDPGALPANTATSLGTREFCARIDENDTLDADEDAVDAVQFDVTAEGIPPETAMMAFSYRLVYDEANFTVQSHDAGFLLASASGSSLFDSSGTLPDTDGSGTWISSGVDLTTNATESASGVLDRVVIDTDAGAAPGLYRLHLDGAGHVDSGNTPHAPETMSDGFIAVNADCPGEEPTPLPPTPTPSEPPTPIPTEPPTPTPRPTQIPPGEGAVTGLFLDSEPDHPIGRGEQFTLTDLQVHYYSADRTFVEFVAFSDHEPATIDFAAPGPLAVGVYENAADWPFGDPSSPLIAASFHGFGCEDQGKFVIHEAVFGPDGYPERFAATFETTCDYWPGKLFGEIRYSSTVALRAVTVLPTLLGPIALPEQEIGTTSSPFNVTIRNDGTQPVRFGQSTFTGEGQDAFGLDYDLCSNTDVEPDDSCSLGVTFSPYKRSFSFTDLTIPDDTYRGERRLSLTGNGSDPLVFLPSSIYFGNPHIGQSAPRLLEVTNGGDAPLVVNSITITGENASEFSIIGDNCTGQAVGGAGYASCAVGLVFTPARLGLRQELLLIVDNSADSPHQVTLEGWGYAESDLKLKAWSDPPRVRTGRFLTYHLDVRNAGPDVAYDSVVSLVLSPQTSLSSALTSTGACSLSQSGLGAELTCDLHDLPPGQEASIEVSVRVTAPGQSLVTARSDVRSASIDWRTEDNTAFLVTPVIGRPAHPR